VPRHCPCPGLDDCPSLWAVRPETVDAFEVLEPEFDCEASVSASKSGTMVVARVS